MVATACLVITGGWVSEYVNVAVVEMVRPHESEAKKVTGLILTQSGSRAMKLLVQVTAPQLSVAVAPPLLANQEAKSEFASVPVHSTLLSRA